MGLNPLKMLSKSAPKQESGRRQAFGKSIGTVIALSGKQ
jgi:hypothetical protein